MDKIAELRAKRAALSDRLQAIAAKDQMTADEIAEADKAAAEIKQIDAQIAVKKAANEAAALTATPVAGQGPSGTIPATVGEKVDKSITVGSVLKMVAMSKGSPHIGRDESIKLYGERHPVTDIYNKALSTSNGTAGGLLVPEDYVADFIELLRPATVVRRAGPVMMPMPWGAIRIPKQTGAASATYGAENAVIGVSQESFGNVIASFKKLSCLVPISNDMMRYASPAIDEIVRNDLIKQMAIAEDRYFLRGDGTADTPRGFRSFTPAANIVASNQVYNLMTATGEIGSAILRLKNANVAMTRPAWFMSPRIEEYLLTVQNSNGFYVFRQEMLEGKLRGYPYYTTTSIPTNLTVGAAQNGSELYLTDMDSVLMCDAMKLRIDVSTESGYVDAAGVQRNAYQLDQTLIRSISEHDFQMRHDEAAAYVAGLLWAPIGS